jgi:hypothetical protein
MKYFTQLLKSCCCDHTRHESEETDSFGYTATIHRMIYSVENHVKYPATVYHAEQSAMQRHSQKTHSIYDHGVGSDYVITVTAANKVGYIRGVLIIPSTGV